MGARLASLWLDQFRSPFFNSGDQSTSIFFFTHHTTTPAVLTEVRSDLSLLGLEPLLGTLQRLVDDLAEMVVMGVDHPASCCWTMRRTMDGVTFMAEAMVP